jgi:hypothetical protein
MAVTPRLTIPTEDEGSRKYLAAAPDGRLMVVVKYVKEKKGQMSWDDKWTCSFKVHVLDGDGQWKETRDIGDASLFVGLNNSLQGFGFRFCIFTGPERNGRNSGISVLFGHPNLNFRTKFAQILIFFKKFCKIPQIQ